MTARAVRGRTIPDGLRLDICENGIKHVTWELADAKADARSSPPHRQRAGRMERLRPRGRGAARRAVELRPGDRHVRAVSWEDAFALVGETLRALESPHQASFYTSGRLSNEATFLYQLWVREFGTNNLPDCSNMCHEASGRAMTPRSEREKARWTCAIGRLPMPSG